MISIDVPIANEAGIALGALRLFAPSDSDDAIFRIDPAEATIYAEEEIQIFEATRYEYEIDPPSLRALSLAGVGAFRPSANPRQKNCGTLDLKAYVGRLAIQFINEDGQVVGSSAIEVRSRKLGYREDLRIMIEEITEHAVELAFELRAPTTLRALPDPTNDSQVAYQQFAFLNGLLGRKSFKDAIQLVLSRPHERIDSQLIQKDIRRGFRPNGKNLLEIARGGNRFPVPSGHPLAARASTLPSSITVASSGRTRDVPENRFVRFALLTFSSFLSNLLEAVSKLNRSEHARLIADCRSLVCSLKNILDHKTLSGLSVLDSIPLSSSVLQQKSGYREILQAWLNFDLAAKLFWEAGSDAYELGRRDVAKLYEYWAFFKLFKIFSEKFPQSPLALSTLIEKTKDKLGLKLKAGRNLSFFGKAHVGSVQINARFDYNRTFKRNFSVADAGSWTEQMRPDYTISFWLGSYEEKEAEALGKISHIHFDAKYRIETLQQIFGDVDSDIQTLVSETDDFNETAEQTSHKRDDLLKMHAYRDAIRRSYGAYILYPGSTGKSWTEFHEILPGVGAFVMRPGVVDNAVSKFFDDIMSHVASGSIRAEVAEHLAGKYVGVKSTASG
ncbi:DUF2357 domain-containing protein [Pseudoduganella sp. FT25W]|uniref:DUF2357 domain-containing protein n=1 Tax=Duganella alba TaxID=2666081 RepID=A0A6L5QBY3_9BURK|nr:DUF2357 domain-containing protein [Duganella alba]MRX07018.1 DUF2357 domain-containing protein [Duganella alba]MRX16085.1 DUF2357 domain-containing protein [Duganella alba]